VVAASEGNVAYDGKGHAVVVYMGYWPHDGFFDGATVAAQCTLDASRNCTWSPTTLNHLDRAGYTPLDGNVADPSVTYDPSTGDFYWGWFDYMFKSNGWLRVARSSDAGATWTTPVDAAANIVDKPWIAANAGSVWAVASDDPGIRIARSSDKGATWDQHLLTVSGEGASYPQAIADAAGNLYLAWWSSVAGPFPQTIGLRVAMWPAGTSCAVMPATEDCFVGKFVAVQAVELTADAIEEVPFAAALNPKDHSLWLAYIHGDRYAHSDVFAVRCNVAASGTTCDAPVRVSQSSASTTCGVRILPVIAFDESGTAHVAWMDGRYGKGDRGRFWYSRSIDGKVWSETVMSDADSVFTVGKEWSAGWLGDYPGIVAGGGRVLATWSDSRDLPPTGIQPTGFVRQRMFLGVL
jgi:hypothetical protein